MEWNLLYENDFLAVRRKFESVNTCFIFRELSAFASVGIHGEQLSATDEGNFFSAFNPYRIRLALQSCSELANVFPVFVHDADYLSAFVLFNTVVPHLINDGLSVR